MALLTIAIASSLIAVSGFAGSAFAKKGKGGSTADTITNSGDSSKDSPTASDSQTPNTHDSSGTTDNSNNTPAPDTGSVSAKDLKTFSTCVSHDALDGRLNLAEVNDCYGQVFDQGFGHALDQGNDLPSTG